MQLYALNIKFYLSIQEEALATIKTAQIQIMTIIPRFIIQIIDKPYLNTITISKNSLL